MQIVLIFLHYLQGQAVGKNFIAERLLPRQTNRLEVSLVFVVFPYSNKYLTFGFGLFEQLSRKDLK